MKIPLKKTYAIAQGSIHNGCPGFLFAFLEILAQSICTHYSDLSGRPDIFLGSGTLKKSGPKYGSEKSRVQKKSSVIVIKKEKRPGCIFSF